MPIAFLAPLFLAGLAALAVPVLIHLANRPRKQVVRFPSLMFLERVDYQATSRRRLRHLVLFALRALAIVLVAAAFARPFVDRPDAPPVAPSGGRELVVLLDRSASMAVGDRMERARSAVAEAASSLRRGDRATLVLFDHGAAAASRATDQAAVLRSAADSVGARAGATRLAPALRLAESMLSGSPLPRRELLVVSDFQRVGWEPTEAPRMPDGTAIRLVAVGDPVDNASVADVAVDRERFSGRDRARLTARVLNRGASPFEAPVELVVDGRVLDAERVAVEPGGEARVTLGPVTLGDRAVPVVVRAGEDALPVDNAHHLVLEPGRSLRVLLIEERGAAPYVARALEVGGQHEVVRLPASRFDPAALTGVDVVVLDGADPGAEPEWRALRTFVEGGGGLVAVLGERSRAGGWGAGLLPGALEGTRSRGGDGAALASVRYEDPRLRPFRAAPAGLTGARFYRYRELQPAPEAQVLARFDDGAPALVAADAGAGQVVVLTTPLDGRWNDLVLQPAFVPLVHGLVRGASGGAPTPAARTVGDLLDLAARGAASSEAVLVTPSGVRLSPADPPLHRLDEVGFYELRDPRAPAPAPPVAVNPDPTESVLEMMDPEEVGAALGGGAAADAGLSFAAEDRERSQSLWWYVLLAAFLMMVGETALSNRLSRRPLALEGGTR